MIRKGTLISVKLLYCWGHLCGY